LIHVGRFCSAGAFRQHFGATLSQSDGGQQQENFAKEAHRRRD